MDIPKVKEYPESRKSMEVKFVELPTSSDSIRCEQSVTNVAERESLGMKIPETGEILDLSEMPCKVEEIEHVVVPASSELVNLQEDMRKLVSTD